MKKFIILLLLLLLLFNACEMVPNNLPNVNNKKEAVSWVNKNIKYRSDIEVQKVIDYWQSSRETLNRGTGDCEDMAILLRAIILHNFGEKTSIIRLVANDNLTAHAVIRDKNDKIYDAVNNSIRKNLHELNKKSKYNYKFDGYLIF